MSHSFNNKILMDTLAWVQEYNMIEKWDKVVVAISWWKDSLSLLDLLVKIKKYFYNNEFEIVAVHIVPMVLDFKDVSPWIIKYYEKYKDDITWVIKHMNLPKGSKVRDWIEEWKTCQWCTYSRRITLIKYAEEIWANKIAYGHHLDDMVDTVFMNVMTGSNMNTMPAFNMMARWNIAIIRPMVLLREKDIVKYSIWRELFPVPCSCPVSKGSFRNEVRDLLDKMDDEYWFVKKFFDAYRKKLPMTDNIFLKRQREIEEVKKLEEWKR